MAKAEEGLILLELRLGGATSGDSRVEIQSRVICAGKSWREPETPGDQGPAGEGEGNSRSLLKHQPGQVWADFLEEAAGQVDCYGQVGCSRPGPLDRGLARPYFSPP